MLIHTGNGNVGYGLVAASYANAGDASTTIGSMLNSTFIGKDGPSGFGFAVYSSTQSTSSTSQSNINIGVISDSTFKGSGYFGGYGFIAESESPLTPNN